MSPNKLGRAERHTQRFTCEELGQYETSFWDKQISQNNVMLVDQTNCSKSPRIETRTRFSRLLQEKIGHNSYLDFGDPAILNFVNKTLKSLLTKHFSK